MTIAPPSVVTRAEVEDFLYHEAALLDDWKLNEWQALLTDDACYYVPPNDQLDSDHRSTLFLVADDRERIRQRVIRINDPNCHAEYPKSRTRRMISNVRIPRVEGDSDGRRHPVATATAVTSASGNMSAPIAVRAVGTAFASRGAC
jgi:3-phenylpropionate/cinnamic acid dioxygenase small subunit